MSLLIRLATLLTLMSGLPAWAGDNPLAGSWKLNPRKSNGPAPSCVHGGVLRIAPEIFMGSATPGSVARIAPAENTKASHEAKCAGVYKFTASPDGRILTMTQVQVDPLYKAVFDRQ